MASWPIIVATPFAFAILLNARPREFGVIFLGGFAGCVASRIGVAALGPDLGSFLGALTVGLVANAYARIADRPSRVVSTPGTFLLVPGSLGFRSLTSFLDREVVGMEWAFQTGVVAVSLVPGLLAANVLSSPRRVL